MTPTPEPTVVPTPVPEPKVSMTMTTDAWEYRIGTKIRYKVTVANEGNVPLEQVTVSDDLNGEPETIDRLAPDAQQELFFEYAIPKDAKVGELKNRAEVSAQPEGGLDEVTADASVSVTVVEGVAAAQIDLPLSVQPGKTVKGTVTIDNGTSKDLTNLKYIVEPEDASVSQTAKRLESDGTLTITYQLELPQDAAPGPKTMGVHISGTSGGKSVKLDALSDVEIARVPKLTVSQEASEASVAPGKSVVFDAKIANEGNVALTGLECSSDLWGIVIDSESVKPSDGAKVNAEALGIQRLEPGESVSYSYSYQVSGSAESGKFENNLTVTGSDELTAEAVTAQGIATVEVSASPGVSLSLTADKTQYAPGEDIQYTLTAQNTGNVPLKDVRLQDLMEGLKLTGIDATDDEGATQPGSEPAVDLPQLSSGASISAAFTATASAVTLSDPGVTISGKRFQLTLKNQAEVSGKSAQDGTKISDQAENSVTIAGDIALGVEASADAESYTPGETARVRVRVYNDGDAAIENIVLENDQGFAYEGKNRASIGVTDASGGTTIERLEPGEDVTLTYSLAVPDDFAQQTLDVNATAKSAYASASGTLSIPVAGKPSGQVLVKMTAVREQVTAGEAAAFDITVTNQSEQVLYAVDVEAGPDGGTFTDLPEGVESDGGAARITELAAGQTLHLNYQVPTQSGNSDNTDLEASVTATGKYDQSREEAVTASASAGVGLKQPEPAADRLPINVLIIGLAALALLAAAGLILLARRKK